VAPSPIEDMSFWKLVENSPEWVTVFTTVLFALITTYIIWRQKVAMEKQVEVMTKQGDAAAKILEEQVRVTRAQGEAATSVMQEQAKVMQWQASNSDLHERQQNHLLQLQHEHEWLNEMNRQRIEIMRLAKTLHINTLIIANKPSPADREAWSVILRTHSELKLQMNLLDVAAYTKTADNWYVKLTSWMDAVFSAITNDFKITDTPGIPHSDTRIAIKAAEDNFNPTAAMFGLQLAIRTETAFFRTKWKVATMVGEED
jgi:hypothetical protein